MSFAACSAVLGALLTTLSALAQTPQPPSATPYPGTIALRVDATDLDHRVLRVQETLTARPGPLTLYFPRWLPGNHAPTGDVSLLAGLQVAADGKAVEWTRDPLDTHAFRVSVPAGAHQLDVSFQYLSAASKESGRRVITSEIVNVQWNSVVLYPSGHTARAVTVQPTLVLPDGWGYGTALRAETEAETQAETQAEGSVVKFKPVSLETLVDSPVFAGRHVRQIALDPPGTLRPVRLTLVADRAELLEPSEAQIEAHRELVRQADKLFASRHFAKYDFLLALSDELGGIGLEHHESSENGVRPEYWEKWDKRIGARDLLPHEFTHSWNGKFRRPADLSTPNFNVPMQNSLLWVYEGQTEFWGWVLAARSGLASVAQSRQRLAQYAAEYEAHVGRQWRNLQDTTNDRIMTLRREKDWRSWQRTGGDYYVESLLVWLDVDTLIREKSAGKRSLDDFARAFFGLRDGELGPLTYRFEDIVAALNAVQPYDWAAFLRERLDGHAAGAPLDGLARAGWRLVYGETPSEEAKAREAEDKLADLSDSIGLQLGNDGKLNIVQWGGAAFDAGLAPGLVLVAVNGRAYKAERLKSAIGANKDGSAPLDLLLRDGDLFRTVRVDYRGGLRYPNLERIEGSEDRLGALLARR